MKKIRFLCAALALILALGALPLTSCSQMSEAIMSISDGEVGKDIDLNTYTFLLSRMKGTLDFYGYDVDDPSFWRTIISSDGKTWDDHFSDTILEQTKLYLIVEYLFELEGLTLEPARAEKVDEMMRKLVEAEGSRTALNATLREFGVNEEMLREIYITEQKFAQLIEYYYGERGEKIEKAQKDAFYNENYVAFGYFFIPTYEIVTGSDGKESAVEHDDAKKSELRAEAVYYANTIDGNIELFREYCEQYGTERSVEPIYLFVEPEYYGMQDESAAYLDKVAKALDAMEVGQCEVIVSQYGYHVICRYENEVGAYDDEKYKESFSDFYAMLSDKLFDEKCATYEEKITVYDIDRPMISEVKSNKLY
jgi:hypothetical protein